MGIELTSCCLLAIIALISLSFADDKITDGRNGWDLLKAEKDPVWRDPPAFLLPKRENYPTPNLKILRELRSVDKLDPKYFSRTKPQNKTTHTLKRKRFILRHFPVPGWKRTFKSRPGNKVRLWLWKLSSCPVLPLWRDYGPTHWPRYINLGQCSQKSTCSYPKGMKCKPSKTKRIRTFFWYCNEKSLPNDCLWVGFPIEVVEKCKCSC